MINESNHLENKSNHLENKLELKKHLPHIVTICILLIIVSTIIFSLTKSEVHEKDWEKYENLWKDQFNADYLHLDNNFPENEIAPKEIEKFFNKNEINKKINQSIDKDILSSAIAREFSAQEKIDSMAYEITFAQAKKAGEYMKKTHGKLLYDKKEKI